MSRIQDILSKAERDGTARRTRSLGHEYDAPPPVGRAIDAPPAERSVGRTAWAPAPPLSDTPRPRSVRAVRPEGASAVAPSSVPVDLPISDPVTRGSAELDQHLVAALAPTSLAAEQYRSLRTRLKRYQLGRALRTIAITSPATGDGKSLTAANLALTMAQEVQQRVLLVDCDLRRPSVHLLFGLEDGPGLVDVLTNTVRLDQALVWLPEYQLTLLPAGKPPANPAELLGSATMGRTLDTLRTRFERILIDVPPVDPLADLHVLAPLVDGLLMIIRAGITQKPTIDRALAGLDPSKVLGLVLNEAGSEGTNENYRYSGYGYIAG